MDKNPELSFKTFGSGKNHIIFLHGYCEVKEMWDEFIPLFSELYKSYSFISVDLPGFGKSPLTVNTDSLLDVANILGRFIKSLGIDSAIWIGHSLGGYVLMNLIKENSDMIKGACLFHSSVFSDSKEKKKQRNKTIKFIEEHGKGAFIQNFIPNLFYSPRKEFLKNAIDNSVKLAMQNYQQSMIRYMEFMRDRPDLSQLLEDAAFPIHFIAGKDDTSVPLKISEKQAKYIEKSSSLFIDRCGHMGMFENPDLCSESINLFISMLSSKH